jgi:hypothetical protein
MELSLVAFVSQHILGLVLNECASNLLLASHRIYGHDATGYIQAFQPVGDGGD